MMKLSDTEKRVLEIFTDGGVITPDRPKVVYPGEWPKGVNVKTVANLWRKGLLTHGPVSVYSCPMMLSKEGAEHAEQERTLCKAAYIDIDAAAFSCAHARHESDEGKWDKAAGRIADAIKQLQAARDKLQGKDVGGKDGEG